MKIHTLLTTGFIALALAGCGSQDVPDPDPEGDGTMVDSNDSMSSTDGFGDEGMGAGVVKDVGVLPVDSVSVEDWHQRMAFMG